MIEKDCLKGRSELLNEIENVALSCYKHNQLNAAINNFHRAYQISRQEGDEVRQVRYILWQGHCLSVLGRLTEALSWLMEVEKLHSSLTDRWFGLLFQLSVARQIPISLSKIQIILQKCINEMEHQGLQKSKNMILVQESYILYHQGDFNSALFRAQEAMATFDVSNPIKYDANVYYRKLIECYLSVGDYYNADLWTRRYEEIITDYEEYKKQDVLSFKQKIALLKQDYPTAWHYAQQCLLIDNLDNKLHCSNLVQTIETGIECHRLDEIRFAFLTLLQRYRQSENAHNRYLIRKLGGDYHLAIAKRNKLHPLDSLRHKRIAYRYYNFALEVGSMIDTRLCCEWRQLDIQKKLRLIEM